MRVSLLCWAVADFDIIINADLGTGYIKNVSDTLL